MSVLLTNVVRGFTHYSGSCVSYSSCSSLLKTINLCIFQSNVFDRVLYRELHISTKTSKKLDPNLVDSKTKPKSEEQKATSKPKKEKQIYITLIGVDNKISVTTQEDALKLSVRRDLKLVKVKDYDTKSQRPTYQLMTNSQYLLGETKENQTKEKKKDSFIKGEKVVSFSHNINEHDLIAKINMMKKWVAKRNEVRVVITGENSNTREEVFKVIESHLKNESRFVQKREKGLDTKFQIIPLKKTEISAPTKESNET